jgi:hypothetical protein
MGFNLLFRLFCLEKSDIIFLYPGNFAFQISAYEFSDFLNIKYILGFLTTQLVTIIKNLKFIFSKKKLIHYNFFGKISSEEFRVKGIYGRKTLFN